MTAIGDIRNQIQGEQHIHEYSSTDINWITTDNHTYPYLCIKCSVIISNHVLFRLQNERKYLCLWLSTAVANYTGQNYTRWLISDWRQNCFQAGICKIATIHPARCRSATICSLWSVNDFCHWADGFCLNQVLCIT